MGTMIRATMLAHHAAFLATHAMAAHAYETKDTAPSLAEVGTTLDKLGGAFEAFQQKNDERLAEIEKKGSADVVTRDELEKINADVAAALEAKRALEDIQTKMARPGAFGGGTREDAPSPEAMEHKSAYLAHIRKPKDRGLEAAYQDAEKKWHDSLGPDERKAVDTLSAGAGGAAVPELISRQIERNLSEASRLRNIVRVVPAGSADFKQLVDTRGFAYGWVGEGDARDPTGTPSLEEVAPSFGTIYAYPKATEESLQDVFFDVENWLAASAVEAFEEGEDAAIVGGNGVKKPTGFLNGPATAAADAARPFGTLQYIPGGSAAALDNGDALIGTVQSIKAGYRANGRWVMNRLTESGVRKLKDGDGDYLWRPGLEMGKPDLLLGYPITPCEDMPDVAADSLPIAFGDFMAGYILVPLAGLRSTRDEVTEPGYVKWYIRRRVGGKLLKSEAIKLLKIAAS